jgi:putative transposase
LEQATKGRFALNAQAVQQIVHAFLITIETTRTLRREQGRVILPMGRGNPSLVLPMAFPEDAGACTLVWNRDFELHVCVEVQEAERAPGLVQATVDLGEIHLAAVTTNTGTALIVTGRGIRSLKRQRSRQLGQLAKKQSQCQKHSRRWKNLGLPQVRLSGPSRSRWLDQYASTGV